MFDYLIDRIKNASFTEEPFRHIHLEEIFKEDDFQKIVMSEEINLKKVSSNKQLFVSLAQQGYRPIHFPGCITDEKYYDKWHSDRESKSVRNQSSCEAFGMTYRLMTPSSEIIIELKKFLESEKFLEALKVKFGLCESYISDNGIQKYLDGYEISPHPDIRKKALTYMVNINPDKNSEKNEHHTHYLKFKSEFKYVEEFWKGNENIDRCWVPWGWCEDVTKQQKNNSMVIFSPANNTMHAVKADYDHFNYQRTQLYGNLWYENAPEIETVTWELLDLVNKQLNRYQNVPLKEKISSLIPQEIKNKLRLRTKVGNRKV